MADPNMFLKAMAFTKTAHRDIYPAVQPTRPELSQAGKVIVITGATRGLGRSFAIAFAHARAGAIALLGRSADALAETAKLVKEISPATRTLCIVVDVLDEAGIGAAFQKITAEIGVPDVLINNAGHCELETIADASVESFWKVQEVNVKGVLIVTKAFLTSIEPNTSSTTEESHPSQPQKTILNLTSISTQSTAATLDSYTISKSALNKFTQFLAAEHPSLTSINLDPGMVPTDMGSSVDMIAPFMFDTPELAAGGAVWLCSGDKRFLSGRYVSVNWDVEEIEARREEIVREDLLVEAGRLVT
ncbi:hypothetical protein BJY00DRAFT_327144 [Aspergillus carlsbadensis]|nr:hypothetical protein BJY00DRAFT_327144 [Aspergillus carlsbadensis]